MISNIDLNELRPHQSIPTVLSVFTDNIKMTNLGIKNR